MKAPWRQLASTLGFLAAGVAGAQTAMPDAQMRCIRDNEKAYQLHAVSQQLVNLRDNRAAIDAALASRPELKKDIRYKNVDEAVTAGMAMYREAGGTAKTLAEVKLVESPCTPAAIAAAQAATPVAAAAPRAEAKAAVMRVSAPARGKGRDADARHCLALKNDRAVMACAEKYR